MSMTAALEEVANGAGGRFDPEVVEAAAAVMSEALPELVNSHVAG